MYTSRVFASLFGGMTHETAGAVLVAQVEIVEREFVVFETVAEIQVSGRKTVAEVLQGPN